MADALLSPAVGVAFLAASGATLVWSARHVGKTLDDHRVPLMGVLGAFVFAAQMINFTIPGTGSSGHLGGGLLLAILLGPCPAFLTIASVLVIQAFFFADGGLLALGTNIFNLGVFPCFLGRPIYRALAGRTPSPGRSSFAAVAAAVAALELGAAGVVLQTLASGRSDLGFGPFLALMAGIHLPVGVIEGLVTAAVVGYVLRARPELAAQAHGDGREMSVRPRSLAPVLLALGIAALLAGGGAAWVASSRPDGLEWSISRATGGNAEKPAGNAAREADPAAAAAGDPRSGLLGATLTLALAGALGYLLSRQRARSPGHGHPHG